MVRRRRHSQGGSREISHASQEEANASISDTDQVSEKRLIAAQ